VVARNSSGQEVRTKKLNPACRLQPTCCTNLSRSLFAGNETADQTFRVALDSGRDHVGIPLELGYNTAGLGSLFQRTFSARCRANMIRVILSIKTRRVQVTRWTRLSD
jgi:hypothetical protein